MFQISNGPLLYIPFLTPESIKSHLQYISDRHQFLPLEIEESYLNGGKFTFRRGKSCIYTIRDESASNSSSDKKTNPGHFSRYISSQNITVIVMNALVFPPSFFGKSDMQLQSDTENKAHVSGKVNLKNHNGMLMGYLTLSISLRNLGEEVALHTEISQDDKEENRHNGALYNLFTDHMKSNKANVYDENQDGMDECERNISLMHRTDNINQDRTVKSTVFEDYIEQSYEFSHMKNHSDKAISNQESSEEIAMRIAALVENEEPHELNSKVVLRSHREKMENISQPQPIFFSGHDLDSERHWNEKMQEFIGILENEDKLHTQKENLENEGKLHPQPENLEQNENSQPECACSIKNESHSIKYTHSEPHSVNRSSDKTRQTAKTLPKSLNHGEKMQVNNRLQTLKTPKGWLRSAPVASCNMQKAAVVPRLTRTSLLRRAKLDPELAHQLNSEVSYQVKQKLNMLEKNFKEELTGIKKRKLMKNKDSRSISVGCQVESVWNEKTVLQKNSDLHKDFTQQTALSNTTHQATQISKNDMLRENDSRIVETERTVSKLEKNRTFEVDIPRFTYGPISTYDDDDFEVSSVSNPDLKSITESEIYEESYEASKCQDTSVHVEETGNSLSISEPKKYSTERRATNTTRDIKMKASESGNHKEQNSDKSSYESSHTLMPGNYSDNKAYSPDGDISHSDKINSSVYHNGSISELDPTSECLSSEASEVTEDSNISKEIYQEIMRGKQADILLRNGSQMHIDTVTHEPSVAEEVFKSSHVSESIFKNVQPGNASDGANSARHKFINGGQTFSIGEIMQSNKEFQDSLQEKSESSNDSQVHLKRKLYKGTKIRELNKTYTKSEPSYLSLEKQGEIQETSEKYSSKSVVTPPGDEEDSTISNISARIAALLMPKDLQVASLHTDSISSYMPSNVSDTLSSLSDME